MSLSRDPNGAWSVQGTRSYRVRKHENRGVKVKVILSEKAAAWVNADKTTSNSIYYDDGLVRRLRFAARSKSCEA